MSDPEAADVARELAESNISASGQSLGDAVKAYARGDYELAASLALDVYRRLCISGVCDYVARKQAQQREDGGS